MTKRASASHGTGSPTSAHARCSDVAMIDVESASVPSQSNTMKRKRRGASSAIRLPSPACGRGAGGEGGEKRRQIRRHRRFDRHFAAIRGMRERKPPCVQEHAFQTLLRERAVPREIAVLVVAGERKAQMREMHADLVRAAGLELG